MSEKTERALDLFSSGFNCAQAVFAAFAEDYGTDEETALRIATGFGGGVRRGEICGAATGAVMAIGAAHGHSQRGDIAAKQEGAERTREFLREFERRNGCLRCRDLLGVDTSTPEGMAEARAQGLFQTKCRDFVAGAVELLEDLDY
ncbi:MAG: C-GCAxxG-C-C family protein [Oscillospiraceae bacterium]|jgi:C_GCAxxG_C_C family probable redox protein|nr:C-GCAxxG-C-C family protein [Oscillospiraceae bacterium]